MRVLKPNYLTPIPTVFDDGRRLHCVLSIVFHAKFDGTLCEERELWPMAGEEVEGMVLDEGMPKSKAEWLAHGSCYATGPDVRQSFVKVRVADQEKILAVFGKRAFKMGVPTTPEPFASVPIRFTHAFGGDGYAENPAGKGFGGGELPQVEVRGQLLRSPGDRPPIATFGRFDVQLPQRMKKAGTYDTKWFKTRYPGMAEDLDYTYFQLASPDQWRNQFFLGNEPFSIVNMHPEKAQLDGALPGVTGRCFVKRAGEAALVDVPLHIDTVHFFPHLERQVIVCRGMTPTKSDLLADIEEVCCGLEWIKSPKTREHYEETFAGRRSKKDGALKSLDDTPLLPEAPPKPKVRLRAPGEGLSERRIRRRIDHEYEKTKQALIDNKIDPAKLPPKPEIDTSVDPDELPPNREPPTMEGVKKMLAEKRAEAVDKMRADVAKMSADLPPEQIAKLKDRLEAVVEKMETEHAGPPQLLRERWREQLTDQITLLKNANLDASKLQLQLDDPATDKRLGEVDEMKRDAYLSQVQYQGVPRSLDRAASEPLRVRAQIQVDAGEPLRGIDFTGADLSGLDLRGANLRGAWLEAADLTGSALEGADLELAVLARAKLPRANLRGCKARGANFSEADLTGADLSGLDLSKCFFVRANLTDAKMSNTTIDNADLEGATLVRTDLSGCSLKNGFLIKLRFDSVSLRDVSWEKTVFYQSEFVDVDARGANMHLVLLVDSRVEKTRFDDANLVKFQAAKIDKKPEFVACSFVGARVHLGMLRGVVFDLCDFSHADLEKSDFSGALVDGSTFSDARAVGARFVSASVRKCKFDRADLMGSFFGGAVMDEASFESANLFRSDFARSVGANVNMSGANVKRVRTVPKREETA